MKNKDLLEAVVADRLTKSMSDELSQEEKEKSFKEAMDAYDRQLETERIESAKKEQMPNRIVRIVEIAGIPVLLTGLDYLSKQKFMRDICNFEKDYTFTTAPSRGFVSSLFRFKK